MTARYILTSYSTDGTIPLPALLAAAAGVGGWTVSGTLTSVTGSARSGAPGPLTMEFVLIVDTARPGRASDVGALWRC